MLRKSALFCVVLMAFAAITVFIKSAGVATAVAPSSPNATCTWNGGSGDWHDAGKWSCGAVPTADDDVVFGGGANLGTISLNQVAPAKNVSIYANGGTISGTGALNVSGVLSVSSFAELTMVTNGSRVPQLQLSAATGTVIRFTDAALTADSLSAVTSTAQGNGATGLKLGARNVGRLVVVGNFTTNDNMTVTQALSLSGSISSGFMNAATMTLGSGAVMTMTDGAYFFMPFVNDGTVNWIGQQSVYGDVAAKWVNNGVLDIRTVSNGSFINFGQNGLPFTNTRTGVMRVNAIGDLRMGWALSNYGLIEINGSTFWAKDANYNQYDGHTQLNGGAMMGVAKCCGLDNYPIYLYGGTLGGSGTITGGIDNIGGTVILDGVLKVTSFYRQSVTGTLQVTLTNSAEPVRLNVVQRLGVTSNGNLEVGGTLIVNKAAGFSPKSGDRFVIGVAAGNAIGAFQQSTGNMAPAFSGFAGAGQLVVAEANNALLLQAKPNQVKGARGTDNGYTVALFNPTTQTIQVNSVSASIPISFGYKPGSTSGAYTSNPFDFVQNGRRELSFSGVITLAAQARKEFQFGIAISNTAPSGSYPIHLSAQVSGLSNPIKLTDVAVIEVPLGSATGVSIGGGRVVTQGDTSRVLFQRNQTGIFGINIRVGIDCPPNFVPCGNLRDVYVGQKVNGRYVNIIKLTKEAAGNAPEAQYGFWSGFIPGGQFYPGVPEKLFPDWDPHRPCIAYDYGGGGGRPLGCVDTGDDIVTPELFDPSGVIRDSNSQLPIANATVTLYRVPAALPDTPTQTRNCRTLDTRGGSDWGNVSAGSGGLFEQPGFTPAQISPNVNPQITGADGRYGWNVVTGCWYVTVSAPGYLPKISALVGVPPEVTDLDLSLTAGEVPRRFVFCRLCANSSVNGR
ncbi:MAG: hypothetical protein HC853_09145 [Anaerolineae bacterium]|nr:hypothetical protein [Anaerolineae bacterium]